MQKNETSEMPHNSKAARGAKRTSNASIDRAIQWAVWLANHRTETEPLPRKSVIGKLTWLPGMAYSADSAAE